MVLADAMVGSWPLTIRPSISVRTPFANAAPIAKVRRKTMPRIRTLTLYLSAERPERPVRRARILRYGEN